MSVLDSIKGTLHHVQEDIKAGFRSLTSKEKSRLSVPTDNSTDDISVHAGADILNKYQQNWIEIHEKSEENAKLADEVDDLVSSIFIHCEKQTKQFNQLQNETISLAQIIKDIETSSSHLATLKESFEKIETALFELEDICECQELAQNKKSHRVQLAKYQEAKRTELEHMKVKLAQEHSSKVQASEMKRVAVLKDRQEAFEEAFESDMKHYKLTGRTERISLASSVGSDHQVDIADIELGSSADEKGALDAFLDDEENPVTSQKEIEKAEPIVRELESAMNEDDDDEESTLPIAVKDDEDVGSDCEILDKPSDQSQQSKSPSSASSGWECINGEKLQESPPES